MKLFWAFQFFIFGTLFGSFFNVLISRLPQNKPISSPPSACPACSHSLAWYENIPVFSYIFLKGKCKQCTLPISLQYPLVELSTGILSLVLYVTYFESLDFVSSHWTILVTSLSEWVALILIIPVAMIDIKFRIIPDKINYFLIVTAVVISFLPGGTTPLEMVIGSLAGPLLFIVGFIGTAIFKRAAIGFGDIKMITWIGAFWGLATAINSLFFGAIIGLLWGVITILTGKKSVVIPFGPSLYIGLFMAVLWGDSISVFTLFGTVSA